MLSFFVVYEISRITVDYIARCLCLQWRRKISIGGGGGGGGGSSNIRTRNSIFCTKHTSNFLVKTKKNGGPKIREASAPGGPAMPLQLKCCCFLLSSPGGQHSRSC